MSYFYTSTQGFFESITKSFTTFRSFLFDGFSLYDYCFDGHSSRNDFYFDFFLIFGDVRLMSCSTNDFHFHFKDCYERFTFIWCLHLTSCLVLSFRECLHSLASTDCSRLNSFQPDFGTFTTDSQVLPLKYRASLIEYRVLCTLSSLARDVTISFILTTYNSLFFNCPE